MRLRKRLGQTVAEGGPVGEGQADPLGAESGFSHWQLWSFFRLAFPPRRQLCCQTYVSAGRKPAMLV